MGVLVISVEDQMTIAAVIDEARAHPTPWSAIESLVIDDRKNPNPEYLFGDRRVEAVDKLRKDYPTQKLELGTYNIAFSFEEQPAGLLRHLSMAVNDPKSTLVPHEATVKMVAEAFGFIGWPPHRGWVEEYEPGRYAVNIVQVEGK
jgi:hypothetical protein